MLKNESVVVVADNSWAKTAQIIRIIKWSMAKTATVWDTVVVAIKSAAPGGSVKKWQVTRAIVVRVRKEIPRNDGTYLRFWDNAVILMSLNDKWEMAPIGKRIFGPVAKELREKGYKNITTMAPEVI